MWMGFEIFKRCGSRKRTELKWRLRFDGITMNDDDEVDDDDGWLGSKREMEWNPNSILYALFTRKWMKFTPNTSGEDGDCWLPPTLSLPLYTLSVSFSPNTWPYRRCALKGRLESNHVDLHHTITIRVKMSVLVLCRIIPIPIPFLSAESDSNSLWWWWCPLIYIFSMDFNSISTSNKNTRSFSINFKIFKNSQKLNWDWFWLVFECVFCVFLVGINFKIFVMFLFKLYRLQIIKIQFKNMTAIQIQIWSELEWWRSESNRFVVVVVVVVLFSFCLHGLQFSFLVSKTCDQIANINHCESIPIFSISPPP